MLDWLGSVQIRHRTSTRVELALTRATAWSGWSLVAGGAWAISRMSIGWICLGVVACAAGGLLGTLRRRLVFDREDGLLRIEQRVFGIRRRAAVPLFHLRSVVVAARHGIHIAFVERRVGGTIHLDESRRAGPLLALAEAICEVTELRLVYDATTGSPAATAD